MPFVGFPISVLFMLPLPSPSQITDIYKRLNQIQPRKLIDENYIFALVALLCTEYRNKNNLELELKKNDEQQKR